MPQAAHSSARASRCIGAPSPDRDARETEPGYYPRMRRWTVTRLVTACTALLAALTAAVPAVAADGTASVIIPRGTKATLDGSLAAGEWEDAAAVPMSDGITLFVKYADGALWLGIRAPEMGVANVLVVDNGDIKVLHSSAALGTARYEPDGNAWRLAQDFVWRCSAIEMSNAAIAERKCFLESEGWLASTAYMGNPGDLEVQVAWDGQPLRLAVLWLPVSNPRNVTSWPKAVPQDTLPAPIPATAHFAPSEWATLELGSTLSMASPPGSIPSPGGAFDNSRRGGQVSPITASFEQTSERWPA